MCTPPCVLFVDELVDTESQPVRKAVFEGVSDLCKARTCAAVWATHKGGELGGGRVRMRGGKVVSTELQAHADEQEEVASTATPSTPSPLISEALIQTNKIFEKATIPPVRNFLSIPSDPSPHSRLDPLEAALSPPTLPPIPRPVWLTISMSIPTGLLWYGYYKFSVEEELFQMELRETGQVSGAGGYGTLVGFSYAVIFGGFFSILPFTEPLGSSILQIAGVLLLASQVNLYVRVNELCEEVGLEKPLHPWWALLPPPLDVVVGLRQVHFLALYATKVRGEEWQGDKVAEGKAERGEKDGRSEATTLVCIALSLLSLPALASLIADYFPFISSERFTLEQFVREPRRWFPLTKDWEDFW